MNNKNKIIYIPLDLDLDLFKFVSIEKLNHLINYSINKNIPYGIFPFFLLHTIMIFLHSEQTIGLNTILN